ncbi:hypothetical protein J6590_027090 [Homalodisca vitripennis]|nr:hypothetical protein J6590_027090 [Homalodisca vitripennis]
MVSGHITRRGRYLLIPYNKARRLNTCACAGCLPAQIARVQIKLLALQSRQTRPTLVIRSGPPERAGQHCGEMSRQLPANGSALAITPHLQPPPDEMHDQDLIKPMIVGSVLLLAGLDPALNLEASFYNKRSSVVSQTRGENSLKEDCHAASWAQQAAVAGYAASGTLGSYNSGYPSGGGSAGDLGTQYYQGTSQQCAQSGASPWARHPQAAATKAVDVPTHWPDNYREDRSTPNIASLIELPETDWCLELNSFSKVRQMIIVRWLNRPKPSPLFSSKWGCESVVTILTLSLGLVTGRENCYDTDTMIDTGLAKEGAG